MLSEKTKGIACGILSAICYGMNPLGALNLYAENLLSAATRILYIYEHSITNNSYLGDVVGVKFG